MVCVKATDKATLLRTNIGVHSPLTIRHRLEAYATLGRRVVAAGSWIFPAGDFETPLHIPESNVTWASRLQPVWKLRRKPLLAHPTRGGSLLNKSRLPRQLFFHRQSVVGLPDIFFLGDVDYILRDTLYEIDDLF